MPLPDRCIITDLHPTECAHCRGEALPAGVVPHWQEREDRVDLPTTVVDVEALTIETLGVYVPGGGLLADLADIYGRLFGEAPALSRGRSTENSAGYAAYKDPRRAPVRIEVLDLIARIEREIPDLTRWVCDACEWIACVAAPDGQRTSGRGGPDTAVVAAFSTLAHYWPLLAEHAPDTADAINLRLHRLVTTGERLLGVVPPPALIDAACPACAEQSIIRVEDGRGNWSAVCTNREDRDPVSDKRRTWTEVEWEDAHRKSA